MKMNKKNRWIFLNSYHDVLEAQEIELVDEEENYSRNVKEMVCDIDDISAEYDWILEQKNDWILEKW